MNIKDIDTKYMVSICMITYNHEPYIIEAIEGVLMQQTTFPYQLVIGEDCSADGSRAICEEYAKKYPNKIRLLPSDKNLGMNSNFIRTMKACTGKYIALCEGDDFWIDESKLQKQVDFMEQNPDFSLCYTHSKEVNEIQNTEKICGANRPLIIDLGYILVEGWFMRTPTLFFQNGIIDKFPDWFYTAYSTDYILHLLLAEKGKVAKLEDITAVYRRHEGGVSIVGIKKQLYRLEKKIDLLNIIDAHFKFKYSNEIKSQQSTYYKNILKICIKYRIYSKYLFNNLSFRNILITIGASKQ